MDNTQMQREELVKQLKEIATKLLENEIETIEGIRGICRIVCQLNESNNEIFFTLRGIESETDQYPSNEIRKNYSKEYLMRIDSETKKYLDDMRHLIERSCKNILEVF